MKKHIIAIAQWNHTDYAGFEGYEYWQSESGQSWNNRHYNESPRKYVPPTSGIKISCQCNMRDNPRQMYGLNVTIATEINMNDIEQVEADVARMKKITKQYAALCGKYGYPKTFSQFAAYIADIVGADLAEYDTRQGDYSTLSLSSLEFKERKLSAPDES